MVLILLSWIYIFFTAFGFGIAFSKLFRIQRFEVVLTPILGLFSITLFATGWAFFGPINLFFHSVLLLLSIVFLYNSKEVVTTVFNTLTEFILWSFPIKILLFISSLLILAQSATLPFIIDNESYYIQTIKWLNEYGFVKGIANLHLFFGQTSGWHITQSVYSFSFLYDRFNDLNGFCMLLGNFFAFQKLNSYFKTSNRLDLIFGLLPLTYVFLFQFISAPSPDLPIYIFGFILFSYYLEREDTEAFIIISTLAFFAFFIKVTAVILLLFPLILLLKRFNSLKSNLFSVVSIGTLVLILFVSKNVILSGYPLFPLLNFRMGELDYTVPTIIMDFFFSKSMLHSFYIDSSAFVNADLVDLVKHYFLYNGLSGYIGIVSVLMILLAPILIFIKKTPKLWTVYFAFIFLSILLVFGSPQYRFYIYFTLFFMLLLVSTLISNPKWIVRLCALSLVIVAILILIPISFGSLTSNTLLAQNHTLHLRSIIIPEANSKWNPEFRGSSVGNMIYQTPVDDSFFWVTGNGKLPCVNEVQIQYFEHGFFYIPQQRSKELKDSFYGQKISGHE